MYGGLPNTTQRGNLEGVGVTECERRGIVGSAGDQRSSRIGTRDPDDAVVGIVEDIVFLFLEDEVDDGVPRGVELRNQYGLEPGSREGWAREGTEWLLHTPVNEGG